MAAIPAYVLEYAPKVWLHSKDAYLPSDIGAQLQHTRPQLNFAPLAGAPAELTLDNLDSLNSLAANPRDIYLTSIDDVTTDPAWLKGVAPDPSGRTNGAISSVLIVNDHGAGIVDAFYMYFWAFNRGGSLFRLNVEFGSHVGDWEHNMIRFKDGQPQALWYSQHATGEAFTYDAVEKDGKRPIAYCSLGTHALYASAGAHDHSIPGVRLPAGPLEDQCDKGKLWDPMLSRYDYTYDGASKTFNPVGAAYPVAYLKFSGRWGDQRYPNSDRRQRTILGINATAKYGGGPTGPEDKELNRPNVCLSTVGRCRIRKTIRP